jgi:hypothetical protein
MKYDIAKKLAEVFFKYQIDYLFIGKSGAIIYGFPDTTQDIDIFPRKDKENCEKIINALKELGFNIDVELADAILKGKDFIQLRGEPFDMDIVFAPDGIESFEEAKKRSEKIDIFPVASLEDIIKSKKSAKRKKDLEVMDRLESFLKYRQKK